MRARAAAALAASTHGLWPAGPDAWRFTAHVGTADRLTGGAEIDGDWLVLTVPTELHDGAEDWQALERNARLPAGVRLVPSGAGWGLRVDVPVAAGADAPADLHAAIAALGAALARGAEQTTRSALPITDAAVMPVAPTRFAAVPRGADAWAVDLGVPAFTTRAVVSRAPDATLAVSVSLAEDVAGPSTDMGRRAVARLLARVGTLVRLVRPAVDVGAPGSLRLEVRGLRPDAAALDDACAALATACRLAAVETTALLSDDALARRFLALDLAAAVARAA